MADVELLPLPDLAACDETVSDMSTTDVREAMSDYARANVAHATATIDAECQMHRAVHLRIDDIVMRAGAFEVLHEGDQAAAWENTVAAVEKFAARATEIEALRAEVERANNWNERVSVCRDHVADIVDGPCVICALYAAEDRAEQLEDALRELVDLKDNVKHSFPNDYAVRKPLAWDKARALLSDQEEGK